MSNDKSSNGEKAITFNLPVMLSNLKHGDRVMDKMANTQVMVEKVDKAGYIVLDATFGESTKPHKREAWLKEYGHDGRYSLSFEVAAERLLL